MVARFCGVHFLVAETLPVLLLVLLLVAVDDTWDGVFVRLGDVNGTLLLGKEGTLVGAFVRGGEVKGTGFFETALVFTGMFVEMPTPLLPSL